MLFLRFQHFLQKQRSESKKPFRPYNINSQVRTAIFRLLHISYFHFKLNEHKIDAIISTF